MLRPNKQGSMRQRRSFGFTLIELMIAVAVVGILAAIAYPSYVDYVRKSRRTDGENAAMLAAQRQEAFYARNATYTTALTDLNMAASSLEGHYTVAITAADATTYTIDVTPQNDQADDLVQGFRLTSAGQKQYTDDGSTWTDGWVAPSGHQ